MNSLHPYSPLLPLVLVLCFLGFGCDSTEPKVISDYKITGFHTALISVDQMDSASGKASGKTLEEGDTVKYNQLALGFESKKNFFSSSLDKNSLFKELFSTHIFGPITTDSISEISVFSNQDFDEETHAGDNLNDKFMILVNGTDPNDGKSQQISLSEFNSRPQHGNATFMLVLKEQPILHTKHTFTVHYRKTDKSLYIFQFPMINVY